MSTLEKVRDYYGRVLQSKHDLKTTACCSAEEFPDWMKPLASAIADEIHETFYGCGVPFPYALKGATVLDLGCGTGRDVFLLSQIVGPEGRVIGVDMTEAQLEVAQRNVDLHMARFGYASPNVELHHGYIEDLESLGIESGSVDVVVSNCVCNLSPDKERVFRETFRVLKPGGELFFSDVYADRRLPDACREDDVLLGECLGGAMYIEDFRRVMARVGCADVRHVRSAPIELTDAAIRSRVGNATFRSVTHRAVKVPLEDRCEDHGQVATYLGTLPHAPHAWSLDDHHRFETGRPMLVCGNTARMLEETRFAPHFKVDGDRGNHFGLFACAPTSAVQVADAAPCC
ncbi:MAG: methyltransferase domain-containing protein [Sandaracinaceae bacterium]